MRTHAFRLLLAAVVLLMVVGCKAGKQHYDLGIQLKDKGNYKEAIAYLEEAIKVEPKNEEYKKALADLKLSLVTDYTQKGAQALAAADPVTYPAIENAKRFLAQAREIDPQAPQVADLDNDIKAKEKVLFETTGILHKKATDLIAAKEWTKGCYILKNDIQPRYPNYENTPALLEDCRAQGSKHYFELGQENFRAEDFVAAQQNYRQALSLDPDMVQARKMLALARENDSKDYFLAKAKEAVMAKNWDRAVQAYERALAYEPDNQELKGLIGHAKLKAGEYYVGQSRGQMDRGRLLEAFDSFTLAKKYVTDSQDYLLNSQAQELTLRAVAVADQFKLQENYGSAWFWYKQLERVNPRYPGLFFLIQEMGDKIKRRVIKSIAVFDFGSPTNSPDAGNILAANLITFLYKNASGDVKILERERLKSILEEMKLGQIGVVEEGTAKSMGLVHGIDVAIMGNVLHYKVESRVNEQTELARYQTGTKSERNIEYENWAAKHPDPNQSELAKAPPAVIRVPVFAEKEYTVKEHTKEGFVAISFRIVDVITGENIKVDTISRSQIVKDVTSEGVRAAEIKPDPLDIPSDTRLLQEVTSGVVAEMGQETLRPLRNLEQTYLKEAQELLRRREAIKAAERFVNAVFDEKLKGKTTPVTEESMKQLINIFMNYTVRL